MSMMPKFWLEPHFEICYVRGFNNKEVNEIVSIIEKNITQFKRKWNDHFKK